MILESKLRFILTALAYLAIKKNVGIGSLKQFKEVAVGSGEIIYFVVVIQK